MHRQVLLKNKKQRRSELKAVKEQLKLLRAGLIGDKDLSESTINHLNMVRKERKDKNFRPDYVDSIAVISDTLEGYLRDQAKIPLHNIGTIGDFKCKLCKSLLWAGERKTICCMQGQTPQIQFSELKNGIKSMYEGNSPLSKRFLDKICGFNALFCFTSFTTSSKLHDPSELTLCYKIQGKIYHTIGHLNPEAIAVSEHVNKTESMPAVSITLRAADGIKTKEHKGLYHLPSASSQVGGIVSFEPNRDPLEITVTSPLPGSNFKTTSLSHLKFHYDAFQYPLLIPNGDIGYCHSMERLSKVRVRGLEPPEEDECDASTGPSTSSTYKRLSPCMFYSFLYMEREGVFNHITKCRRLFQQFVVDNYVKVESNRLSYLEMNQKRIRKERADILCLGSDKVADTGQRVVLPSTFIGSPRYMKERQQDALTYVTCYGSPDYFITFTMNPHWRELQVAMDDTGSAGIRSIGDRPDLISRVFKLKVDSLMHDLVSKQIFGRVKAHLYGVEWQKRGLPHVHILLWMNERVTAERVSRIISAEIPNKEAEPRLYDVVTRCMIHGPCKGYDESLLCCQKSKPTASTCGKGFPKTCRNDLMFGNNGYPEYKRRSIGEGGESFVTKVKGVKKVIDNSWVVPYSPYLCVKYDAHINVECSNSIKAIAYVTKYVNKGCDRVLFSKTTKDGTVNEIKNFQKARYINANEATWKIFGFDIYKSYPPVSSLDLHLEGENEVFYDENSSKGTVTAKAKQDTQLTVCEI
ncbi:uncharacterized protein LOC143023043 [Oratosquilla oratoria]|uniref:uncharacterized protein LOC143023043 n=1 Tax=Oratosquilla oratoria TaxID=337810 RepID=UPI003F77199B